MSEDQNQQNIYRPLIVNQQYQGINTQVEPINYQPQIQEYDPPQYYVMDPNIIQVNTLPQSDKIKDQTEAEQVNFLTKITVATLFQQFSQVILCMITFSNRNISGNFYDYETQTHNFIVYLCFFILIGIILVAKYTKLGNNQSMAFFMLFSFMIIFDVFACAFISGCNQGIFDSGMPSSAILWFLYFLEGYLTFLTFLIILIQLTIEKKTPKIAIYSVKIVAIQFAIYIISSFMLNASFLLNTIIFGVILIVSSIPFTWFYLYNMNCIIKGSGNLDKDQYILAIILVYFPY